jgi:uncharacterized protein YkwD
MLSTKLILCAAMLMLGDVEAAEKTPQPQAEQKSQAADNVKNREPLTDKAKPEAMSPELEEKTVDGVKLQAIEANVVSYTNQERVRNGLSPLKVDKELMETAREHAAWMTRNRSMVHTWRSVAENIAMGQPHSSDVVRAWMNSSGHRANILNSNHQKIGVAAFCTDAGTIFWCQQFRR